MPITRLVPVAVVLAAVMGLAGCSPAGTTPPSSQEARLALDRLVRAAQQGDFETLCRSADGEQHPNCVGILDAVGRDVPDRAPTVVGERTMNAGSHTAAGRILTVCGIDDQGRPYTSEVLFFYHSGRLDVIQPVWWSGYGIGESGDGPIGSATTGESPQADCARRAP